MWGGEEFSGGQLQHREAVAEVCNPIKTVFWKVHTLLCAGMYKGLAGTIAKGKFFFFLPDDDGIFLCFLPHFDLPSTTFQLSRGRVHSTYFFCPFTKHAKQET